MPQSLPEAPVTHPSTYHGKLGKQSPHRPSWQCLWHTPGHKTHPQAPGKQQRFALRAVVRRRTHGHLDKYFPGSLSSYVFQCFSFHLYCLKGSSLGHAALVITGSGWPTSCPPAFQIVPALFNHFIKDKEEDAGSMLSKQSRWRRLGIRLVLTVLNKLN